MKLKARIKGSLNEVTRFGINKDGVYLAYINGHYVEDPDAQESLEISVSEVIIK